MPCSRPQWNWARGLLLLALAPALLWAQEGSVPVDKRAAILLKALSYDRNLKSRSGESIRIAVLYKGEQARTEADEIARAFLRAGKDGVQGLPVDTWTVEFVSIGALLKRVEEDGFNLLYVHDSLTTALSSVQQVARGLKILSLSGEKKLVEQGLSLGVYIQNQAPRLVVHLQAGRMEGLDLDPAILLIATVIKSELRQ